MPATSPDSAEHVNKKRRIDKDSFGTDMVQVKVGPKKTIFKLHKQILCNVAPYFEAAFKGGFAETQDQELLLSDASPVMFKLFELWVYTGHVLAKEEAVADISWDSLVNLYIFGEKCGVPDLQNAAIDVLIDKRSSENGIPAHTLLRIYDNTPEDSSLRRLLVDLMANANLASMVPKDSNTSIPARAHCEWFRGRERYPKDFLFDLAFAENQLIFGGKTRITDFKLRRADYYIKPRDTTSITPATGQQ